MLMSNHDKCNIGQKHSIIYPPQKHNYVKKIILYTFSQLTIIIIIVFIIVPRP